MMCDECGVRPANIHLTTFVNGEKQERNLCATCMTKYKKQLPNMDLGELAGLLGGFLKRRWRTGRARKKIGLTRCVRAAA